MATLDQVISQIRFGLEQLSAKNAHHEFEHMCRHLTRARICSNILPATGPVSAGGDQGRDFETFRTYLNKTLIADSSFIGLASVKPMAFACTLEKKAKIKGKIESDVKTIMSSGTEIEAVHYFCSADIEVAKRHKLKEWARDNYRVELEIYDGQAISELLAGRDVFWIAERYLSIPAEIFPRLPGSENGAWYSAVFGEWKNKKPSGDNYAEFSEIKQAARHSFYNKNLKQDLPFWINLIKDNFINSRFNDLRHRAIYEACVLNVRGFRDLSGYEEPLRAYFSQISELDTTELSDAETLLQYSGTAAILGALQISTNEIKDWQNQVEIQIDKKLDETNSNNTQATLLHAKGWSVIKIDLTNPQKKPDFEKGIEWWLKLIAVLDSAPMFPLKHFSNNVTKLLKLIIDVSGKDEIPNTYFELTEKLDQLLAKRLGSFTAAESSRKRAVLLAENNRLLDAINLFHHSKLDWYASETLPQALSMMQFLATAYAELGLFFAAKYYAFAISFIGINNPQPEVKQYSSIGLMKAATYDYILGAFCSFLVLTELEIKIHSVHARDAGDLDKNEELQSIVFHLLMLKAITEKLHPDFDKVVEEKINQLLPNEWIEEILPSSRQSLAGMDDESLKQHISSELSGIPFNDLDSERKVSWMAAGIEWNVSWNNDYETTKQAEQFLAILQIYLVEIAQADLCLLKTKVEILIELSNSQEIEVEQIPSNEKRIWKILLPKGAVRSSDKVIDKNFHVFSAVSHILFVVALLPEDKYYEVMKTLFERGLNNKIFVAQPYEVLYSDFVRAKDFDQFDRQNNQYSFSGIKMSLSEHEELKWNDQPGPTYNQEEAEQILKSRYLNVSAQFQMALEILGKTVNFKEIIKQLREEGWLDWHIMSAITHAAANYQFNLRIRNVENRSEVQNLWFDILSGKFEWRMVPPEEFSKDKLLHALRASMLSTVKLLGLECRQITPDLEAIDNFLRCKYNYWTDDVQHEELIVSH